MESHDYHLNDIEYVYGVPNNRGIVSSCLVSSHLVLIAGSEGGPRRTRKEKTICGLLWSQSRPSIVWERNSSIGENLAEHTPAIVQRSSGMPPTGSGARLERTAGRSMPNMTRKGPNDEGRTTPASSSATAATPSGKGSLVWHPCHVMSTCPPARPHRLSFIFKISNPFKLVCPF